METKYISYSRVSTNEQSENGVSIEAQIEEHKLWADKHGVMIDYYFSDSGYSAGSFKRPGLQSMLQLISSNKKLPGKQGYPVHFIVLIRYQSRLIRDMTKKRSLQCVFKKFNVTVQCLNGKWEGSPADDGLASDIQMLFDENERKQVSGRVFDSYRHIALAGGYPLGGPKAPWGYKREKFGKNIRLVPDPETASVVQELFGILATGEYTPKKARALFNARGYLDGKWTEDKMLKIFDNPIYYGRFLQKWFDSDDPTISDALKSGWYSTDCHTEPLVSRDLFEKVQSVLHTKRMPTRHTYFFEKKIKCCHCGSVMAPSCAWRVKSRGSSEYVLYKYYICNSCIKRINENVILEHFLDHYPEWERKSDHQTYVESLNRKIIAKEDQIKLTTELFEEGTIDLSEYSSSLKSLKKEIKVLKDELSNFRECRKRDWDQFSDTEKKAIVKTSVEYIRVKPGPMGKAEIIEIVFFDSVPCLKKS